MTTKETIRNIKSDFFALRNGEIADRLCKAGNPYKIIFGLQIPQLESIAAKTGPSQEIANLLWDNTTTRESRLLATMLYPHEYVTIETATKWIDSVDTNELADILCFKLLRNIEGTEKLIAAYINGDNLKRYTALRLAMNLLILRKLTDLETVKDFAQKELAKGTNKMVARQILDEIEFIEESN